MKNTLIRSKIYVLTNNKADLLQVTNIYSAHIMAKVKWMKKTFHVSFNL